MGRLRSFVVAPFLTAVSLTSLLPLTNASVAQSRPVEVAQGSAQIDAVVDCEIMIVGGGLAGTAAARESLLLGRTVCLTDITDWVGGQLTSQGTTALDEVKGQREADLFPAGYREMRARVTEKYGVLNPGKCWVSLSCFPTDGAYEILMEMLTDAEAEGGGQLKWFPNTVVKALNLNAAGNQIESLVAIQHAPAPGTAPLNTEPLSAVIEDAYTYADSDRLMKTIIQFEPAESSVAAVGPADWYVVEATETGEIIALADVPYRLGIDPRSAYNPSSPVTERDPYCTQGFTYPFAAYHTAEAQTYDIPDFYETYEPIYGFNPRPQNSAVFDAQGYMDFVLTYRRLWSEAPQRSETIFNVPRPSAGDILMQNWLPGNDYNPGTSRDNLIYTREQLTTTGQMNRGGWMGGLRTETLRKGEENAIGFFYWLATSDTNNPNFQLDPVFGDEIKNPYPYLELMQGLDSPMGTRHGLSKYPYIREARRIIGRASPGYWDGFSLNEVDVAWKDYDEDFYYQETLDAETYLQLRRELAGIYTTEAIVNGTPADGIPPRNRSRIFPDAVGISQYTIDFHPCYRDYPVEAVGNIERPGIRQGHGPAYPGQIPLRAMIPQDIDNLMVAGKSIAMSYIVAAGYRVHSFEWSVGAAAAHTLDFALRNDVLPYELVDDLPGREPMLEALQSQITASGNPIAFPGTSIFNRDWNNWRP